MWSRKADDAYFKDIVYRYDYERVVDDGYQGDYSRPCSPRRQAESVRGAPDHMLCLDVSMQTVMGGTPGPRKVGVSSPRRERYYAGIPDRAAALLIDAVLLSVAIFLAAAAVSVVLGPAVEFDSAADSVSDAVTLDRGVATVDAAISLVLSAMYFVVFWVRRGATPGQRLLGLAVAGAADGRRLTAPQASIRWLALAGPLGVAALLTTAIPELSAALIDLAVVAWLLLLAISVSTSPAKQGLHDRLAGSVVAKQASPVPWPLRPSGAE